MLNEYFLKKTIKCLTGVVQRFYIVCLNEKQARKNVADRKAIIDSLQEKLKTNPKSLVGNKGYRKYLKLDRETVSVNQEKIEEDARYDGKWVLKTNTTLTAEQVALKYKELWRVEQVFRDMKSLLDTRPIFHKLDETIRGHVFCRFPGPGHPEGVGSQVGEGRPLFRVGRHQAGSQGPAGDHD
jgi:hypothetical protein